MYPRAQDVVSSVSPLSLSGCLVCMCICCVKHRVPPQVDHDVDIVQIGLLDGTYLEAPTGGGAHVHDSTLWQAMRMPAHGWQVSYALRVNMRPDMRAAKTTRMSCGTQCVAPCVPPEYRPRM